MGYALRCCSTGCYPLLCLTLAMFGLGGCSGQGENAEDSPNAARPNHQQAADPSRLSDAGPIEDPLLEMPENRSRFRLIYEAKILALPGNSNVRVWVPLAQSTPHQWVQVTNIDVPAEFEQNTEGVYGNRLLYFETHLPERAEIPIRIEYEVSRFEVNSSNYESISDEDFELYLRPNRLVPTDESLFTTLFPTGQDDSGNAITAREIYDRVLEHVDYRKPEGEPWGQGNAVWVCDSQFGNCTDFHSLFIALCRTRAIPARFEIGFELSSSSNEISGYHCWAFFARDRQWMPVDISTADQHSDRVDELFGSLPPDRVMLTRGRDLQLSPPQDGGAINYLIDPYVEVDHERYTKMERNYRFEWIERYSPSENSAAPNKPSSIDTSKGERPR